MENTLLQSYISIPSSLKVSKKYSKVNDDLKKEFLSLIILKNRSIKEASASLNINYSSAKAILASHRKHLHTPKPMSKNAIQAQFKDISPFDPHMATFKLIFSTGGCETSSIDQFQKTRLFYKASISPVILLKSDKESESSEQTIHKQV